MLKRAIRRLLPTRLWACLRLLRLQHTLRHYRPRQVRHTYGGFPLDIYLADPLAEGWYDHDWPELAEIDLLRRHRLKPAAHVFNIGAHQGVVALMLARIVGPAGRVVAVEANAHNAAIARQNRDLNKADQLHVVHAAAAEKSGTIFFGASLNGQVDDGSGAWGRGEVTAVSIDDLSREHGGPDVLFIDVEGFEEQVLSGARETLRPRPDCFVEVHVGAGLEKFGASAQSVLAFFPPEVYDRYIAGGGWRGFIPLPPEGVPANERFLLIAIARGQMDCGKT